jgi:hypothetical protein
MLLRLMLMLVLCAAPASPAWAGSRGSGADGQFSERKSSHFRLLQDVDIDRYSGVHGSRRFEQDVLVVLEAAYGEVGDTLAIRPRRELAVVVYDPEIFDQRFGGLFGFRAAGFFDGVIHVRGSTRIDERLVRTLHHEYSHAALHSVAPGVAPAWLNEGLAEYFERLAAGRRHLSHGENAYLKQAAQNGQWIPMQALSAPSFAHMGGDAASLAYLESYALIEHLIRKSGARDLRTFWERLVKTRNVQRALDRTYRRSLAELEADLLAEVRL